MKEESVFETIVCPTGEGNPRNSEASVGELRDGRLLLAYTDCYGTAEDEGAARISGKLSSDRGRTWSEKFTIQDNVGQQNVMCATLLRLRSGEMAFFYLQKNSAGDLKAYVKRSFDEGQTWSEAVCVTPKPGYHVMNNDRVIQLSSGRLLAPVAHTPDCWVEVPNEGAPPGLEVYEIEGRRVLGNHMRAWCYLSDDNGRTWKMGEGQVDLPSIGVQEPGLVELKDGRVLMIMRTKLGCIYKAHSDDGGSTWSGARPTNLIAPVSPCTIKRIPTTGDLLMIWNHTRSAVRSPLTTAFSRDEGETWENIKDLEPRSDKMSYGYPSALFVGKEAVLTYYSGVEEGTAGLWSLKLKIVPMTWFYA